MIRPLLSYAAAPLLGLSSVTAAAPFQPAKCEGVYLKHLQGICTDDRSAIYWSWTDALVKTDSTGRILARVEAPSHQGDLCYHDGRLYVAVNLGKFNEPPGQAKSWVFVFDGETLAEIARHPVPEVVHGAGGIAYHQGKFIVVGGLPPGVDENYLYEYDQEFRFQKRHVLTSGYTKMGVQTVAFADGAWWFGSYGTPQVLLRADEQFRFTGKWEFDASLGIVPIGEGRFLIGQNTLEKGKGHHGRVVVAAQHPRRGLVVEEKP